MRRDELIAHLQRMAPECDECEESAALLSSDAPKAAAIRELARRRDELERAIDYIEAVSCKGGIADLENAVDEMKGIAAAHRARRRLQP